VGQHMGRLSGVGDSVEVGLELNKKSPWGVVGGWQGVEGGAVKGWFGGMEVRPAKEGRGGRGGVGGPKGCVWGAVPNGWGQGSEAIGGVAV
jgi:hypothetical protein